MAATGLRGILFDLDGVLYNSGQPIQGAAEAVEWFRTNGVPHLFLTNTTSRSRGDLVGKLTSLGFLSTAAQILTPAVAAAGWLRAQKAAAVALFVPESTRREFSDLTCLPDSADCDASHVVIGDLGQQWNFGVLNRAFRLLHQNPACALIALGMTRYWRADEGMLLDAGPFVAALEYASSRKALVFGKPAEAFFLAGVEKLGLTTSQTLMIGDDLTTDIGGAQSAGLKGALVKTGKFRPEDLDGQIKPYAILESVADLPSWWTRSLFQTSVDE